MHNFDERTPIEETVRTLDDLQAQGKILYPAVSNWAAWQIATALGVAAREHLARFERSRLGVGGQFGQMFRLQGLEKD